jgi:hypothetical protein
MLFRPSGHRPSRRHFNELNELVLKEKPIVWKGKIYSSPNCATPGIQKQVKEFSSVTRRQATIMFSIPEYSRFSARSRD